MQKKSNTNEFNIYIYTFNTFTIYVYVFILFLVHSLLSPSLRRSLAWGWIVKTASQADDDKDPSQTPLCKDSEGESWINVWNLSLLKSLKDQTMVPLYSEYAQGPNHR